MHIYTDFQSLCEIELWETHTVPILHFPRENQFRRKRTVLITTTFHFTFTDSLAESKIEKRMRDEHFFALPFNCAFSREIKIRETRT